MAEQPILELEGVRVSYFSRGQENNVVPGVTMSIAPGEAFGLIGESGSGKSTVAAAVMQYMGGSGRIMEGSIRFLGKDLCSLSPEELRGLRGRQIAMVFQDPMSSLNPLLKIGRQLTELPMLHFGDSLQDATAKAIRTLEEVKLRDPESVMNSYPHQLSGGQQQRVVIAMALINNPALLVMDEPTTGLDPTIESAILELVNDLRRSHRTAILFISHSVHAVAAVCDRIGVMYKGEIVETGPVQETLRAPVHPYTRALLACIPSQAHGKHHNPLRAIPAETFQPSNGCRFAGRCAFVLPKCNETNVDLTSVHGDSARLARCIRLDEGDLTAPRLDASGVATEQAVPSSVALSIKQLSKTYTRRVSLFNDASSDKIVALNKVSIEAPRGRVLAIVGESGSGKSTLARIISGLAKSDSGVAMLGKIDIAQLTVEDRSMALKQQVQMVFQNPESTLNPSHTIGYIIGRALRKLRKTPRSKLKAEVAALLVKVGLEKRYASLRPGQLSGGQKQRVSIARALAGTPALVVADEPVSALDLSVQASIVQLLDEMRQATDMTLVFISHDLPMVRYLSDTVAVLYRGELVEHGPTETVFRGPQHDYTKALLASAFGSEHLSEPTSEGSLAPI